MADKPTIGNAQIRLLEKLCNACAVSGDEGEVRQIVRKEIEGHANDVKVDALGNVLVTKKGTSRNRVRVMVSAHMDEVGFMLVAEDGEGLYRFEIVGGIDPRQLVGKPVLVGKGHTPGVIGARPIHLTTAEERKRAIPLDALRIDIGPGGKAKLGDRATFATKFQRSGPSLIAKSLDNRLGVATLIELVKHAPANIDLLAAFSVQEEIGLRGAKVAAHAFDPDMAVAIDSTPANDLPSWDKEEENVSYNAKLGLGPAIYTADAATLSDPRLIRHFAAVGDAEGIPYQMRQPGGGGTDAGAIHRSRAGIPSVSVSVPHRYTHSAASIARLDDWKNYLALIHAALNRVTPGLLSGER
jgi:endoglucanase